MIASEDVRKIRQIILGFLGGAILLCATSVIQKLIAGYNPLLLKGYIIPVLFGGTSGSIIGFYLYKVKKLNELLSHRVHKLESILSICSNCKKIKKPGSDPKSRNSWQEVESYISAITTSELSHSICPNCIDELYGKDFLS